MASKRNPKLKGKALARHKQNRAGNRKVAAEKARVIPAEEIVSRSQYDPDHVESSGIRTARRLRKKFVGKNTATAPPQSRKLKEQATRDLIRKLKGAAYQDTKPEAVGQVPLAKEHKAHVVLHSGPYTSGDRKPDAVTVSRSHNGGDYADASAVKGKGRKVKKHKKAMFTWQDRVAMQTAAAVKDKKPVTPRVEVKRHDPAELRVAKRKAVALYRSDLIAARDQMHKEDKLAHRETVGRLLSRITPKTYVKKFVFKAIEVRDRKPNDLRQQLIKHAAQAKRDRKAAMRAQTWTGAMETSLPLAA